MVGVPVWSHDGIVCTGETYKAVVKLTFAKGASLPDPAGLFNASDDSEIRMGDWLDRVADHAGLPRPPRLARAQFKDINDFMQESRRLDNRRLKEVLGLRLRYPTVEEGLANEQTAGADQPA